MKTGHREIPEPIPLGDVAWEVATSAPAKFVPTGIPPLDDLIVGVTSSELMIIAGSPSQGKTALGMQIVENTASMGTPCGVFSLEMGTAALSLRMVAAHSGVSILRLRRRGIEPLTKEEQGRVEKAAKYLQSLPIAVDTRSGLTGEQVYDTVRYWKTLGVGMVLLDYLQLMEGDNENRQEAVGKNVRMLKNAARDFDLPFIALSQVSRASGMREDKRPRMSDLRDSGQIEQVGDTILMFHYPADDSDQPIREVDVHAVKQRQGPVGHAALYFRKEQTRFVERADGEQPERDEPEDEDDDTSEDTENVRRRVWGDK